LIERFKRENPHRTGTALLRVALASPQNQAGLSASRLYRFLRDRGLTEHQLLLAKATPHKKYEAQYANQIWQSDMLIGPWVQCPGGGKMQVFLQATLDDASRLIAHAQFYPNQGLDSFLDCLRQAVATRGIPTSQYSDNGKIYRLPQLARIAAGLGILMVHTPPYYQPEGRGKIERWFGSVRQQFLGNLEPKVLLSLEQLNERLWHWIETIYHRTPHSSFGPLHCCAGNAISSVSAADAGPGNAGSGWAGRGSGRKAARYTAGPSRRMGVESALGRPTPSYS
jgi:transposase InsO family protein